MAYADQEMSSRRVFAIGAVALLHAGVGYALVSGLAYNAAKAVYEDLKTFDVAPEPPPPEDEPPPPPPDAAPPPPPAATAPPPRVVTQAVTTNQIRVDPVPPPPPPKAEPKPEPKVEPKVVPPPPPAPKLAEKAVIKRGSISNDDYPSSAKRNEEAGTSVASFTISTDGSVTDCNASGAGPTLDAETCRLIIKRFKFKPAKDTAGNPISERRTQRVTWRLED